MNNDTTTPAPPRIFPHHWKELQASGLTPETVREAGIYSEAAPVKLAAILGWRKVSKKLAPAIVFPFVGPNGNEGYARIKPDIPRLVGGKEVKYESPRGRGNHIYLPAAAAGKLDDPTAELLITEGEKKSLKSTQDGFPCIGLVGVFGWKDGRGESLLPDLERIAWNGREVRLVFDSDIADNPNIQDAESRLAARLAALGAKVKVVRLPAAGDEKVGLDDFLVAHGAGELRKLLDQAIDPSPPAPGTMRANSSELDPATECRAFLEASEKDGVPLLRFWRGTFHRWRAGRYTEVPKSEIRAQVVRRLNKTFFKLRGSVVSDVLDQLRAQSILPSSIEQPSWLGPKATRPTWSPLEILSTRNALVHLPSLAAAEDCQLPPTPRLFTPTAVNFDFDPNPPAMPAWTSFLQQLWEDDDQSIQTLREWFGYCLTPDTTQQKIAMIVGPKRSGKGTIARVLRQLVGTANVVGPTLASLATNFGLWPLLGKTVAIVSDARLGGRTDSATVVERLLSISGEDALTIDRKNIEPVTCKLPTRIMLLSNELPRLGDSSGALAGRMILLKLTKSFFDQEDPGLTNRLLAELPSILIWAISGWSQLRERGYFVQPPSGQELAEDLHDLSSPVAAFVRDQCNVGRGHNVPRGDLYAAYRDWAAAAGRKFIEDQIGFGRALRAVLPTVGTTHRRIMGERIRFYEGVGLSETDAFGG